MWPSKSSGPHLTPGNQFLSRGDPWFFKAHNLPGRPPGTRQGPARDPPEPPAFSALLFISSWIWGGRSSMRHSGSWIADTIIQWLDQGWTIQTPGDDPFRILRGPRECFFTVPVRSSCRLRTVTSQSNDGRERTPLPHRAIPHSSIVLLMFGFPVQWCGCGWWWWSLFTQLPAIIPLQHDAPRQMPSSKRHSSLAVVPSPQSTGTDICSQDQQRNSPVSWC